METKRLEGKKGLLVEVRPTWEVSGKEAGLKSLSPWPRGWMQTQGEDLRLSVL